MKKYQITQWCHRLIQEHVQPGDLCIDATAGNGHDTLLLCRLSGSSGRVLAFDIQQQALDATSQRLLDAGIQTGYDLILDSHIHMDQYAKEGSVSCVVFNLGYLPSGDHTIATQPQTTIQALITALRLLKADGILSLCIYSGKDSGYAERDAVLNFLETLDPRQYLVIVSHYYNRPNDPPIPVLIHRLK